MQASPTGTHASDLARVGRRPTEQLRGSREHLELREPCGGRLLASKLPLHTRDHAPAPRASPNLLDLDPNGHDAISVARLD
jgi:hypothetical protein